MFIKCTRYVKGVWLVTPNTVQGGGGSARITFSSPKTQSVPNVLTRIVVVNHLSLQKSCTNSGSFGMFIIFALESVCCRDMLYFNSISFKNSPILFKYWRVCILIKNILFWKKDHHAVGLPHPKLKPVIFVRWNLFLTLTRRYGAYTSASSLWN